jgi:enamine deaminase RidA (YjgF/YER057c/UK114 family)
LGFSPVCGSLARIHKENPEEESMTVTRIDAGARMSDVIIHNQTLYYTGVPENLDADAFEQTANTLAQIDAVLAKQGSDKTRILDVTIFLVEKSDFAAMNKAWDAWVVAGQAPVRCTVQAELMNPKYKVEIKIVAAV